jgi:hypothetical protein
MRKFATACETHGMVYPPITIRLSSIFAWQYLLSPKPKVAGSNPAGDTLSKSLRTPELAYLPESGQSGLEALIPP